MTMAAFLYTSNSALAASYGSMGGSSSSSYSSSSNDGASSYRYSSSTIRTCTCNTAFTQCSDCEFKNKIVAIVSLIGIIIVSIDAANKAFANHSGTMLIFQVGVLDKQRVLQRQLNKIAENADTSTLEGLDYILKETVRALPQHDNSDNPSSNYYSYIFEKYDSMESLIKYFLEVTEKFDKFVRDDKTFVNVDGVKYKTNAGIVKAKKGIDNEYTLATICVLARGEYRTPVKKEMKRDYVDSFAVLQTLLCIPKTDIKSVRVMWSPQKEDEVLMEEDLRGQTNLMPVVNGRVFLI